MYDPYVNYTKNYFRNAKPITDSFHVVKWILHLIQIYINQVKKRYQEHDRKALDPNFNKIKLYKDLYETFNGQYINDREGASARLDELIEFYKDCDLQIFREFSVLLSKYHDSIVNSFKYVTAAESSRYKEQLRRLSNGPMESFNNIPSGYRTQSHGIEDFEFARNRILWAYRQDAHILGVPKSAAGVHNYTGKKRCQNKKKNEKKKE